MVETTLRWRGGLGFDARTARGDLVVGPADAGPGPTFGPKELVALGLGGCSGMDVAAIFEKMRLKPDRFEVEVAAESAQGYPQRMVRFAVRYIIDGAVAPEQAQRAVELSLTRYCGVAATLARSAEVVPEIVLNGSVLSTLSPAAVATAAHAAP